MYEDMDAVRIGNTIKALREKKGETAEMLSGALNISNSAIAMYDLPSQSCPVRHADCWG